VFVKRLLLCAASLALVASSGAGVSALASPPSPDDPAGHSSEILGVVPVHGQAKPGGGGGGTAGNNLAYHNGPVMLTNKTVAIYWAPAGWTVASGYKSVINGFFGNVAANSGATTSNVYFADTQYYNLSNQKILNTGGTAASVDYAGSFPAANAQCNDGLSLTTVCVTDAQIQAAVEAAVPSPDASTIYFVFTPQNVGSCAGSACAFSYYCAYHSSVSVGNKTWIYANQPYADTYPSACDAGQHPNAATDPGADATLNVASHEHNEAITDPFGSAWYDRRGAENGDKCAWTFGSALGSTGGANTAYNQQIGGGRYYLQQEWSNKSGSCVLTGQ